MTLLRCLQYNLSRRCWSTATENELIRAGALCNVVDEVPAREVTQLHGEPVLRLGCETVVCHILPQGGVEPEADQSRALVIACQVCTCLIKLSDHINVLGVNTAQTGVVSNNTIKTDLALDYAFFCLVTDWVRHFTISGHGCVISVVEVTILVALHTSHVCSKGHDFVTV